VAAHRRARAVSFAWLGALGERTTRITLGTSVVTPTFRYHPAIVAQAMATLGALYPGRVLVGVGTGESMNEVPVLGIEWPDSKERFARLKEAVGLMHRLWTEERVTHDGDYFHTRGATVYDRPERPVPMYIAPFGESAARLAGGVADGLIVTSGKARALYTETILPTFTEGSKRAGRDESELEKMVEVKVSFDSDRRRALEETRHWAALALPAEDKVGVDDPRELERRAPALPLEKAASRWLVSDDPDEMVELIGPYIDDGFTHLVFHAPGPDQLRFQEQFSSLVLPTLRARFGEAVGEESHVGRIRVV
jgi:coenzyme F420-dependent glucose-6-phosphate dehydrogenase